MIFGALGVVWAAAFYRWFRDNPAEHSEINQAELAHIGVPEKTPEKTAAEHADHSIPWSIVLSSPNVWLLGLIQMVGATLFYMRKSESRHCDERGERSSLSTLADSNCLASLSRPVSA